MLIRGPRPTSIGDNDGGDRLEAYNTNRCQVPAVSDLRVVTCLWLMLAAVVYASLRELS